MASEKRTRLKKALPKDNKVPHQDDLSELQTHPNLHSRHSSPAIGYTFGCVCVLLYGLVLPGVRLQIWVCLICIISTYSIRAVHIRVGLELAYDLARAGAALKGMNLHLRKPICGFLLLGCHACRSPL